MTFDMIMVSATTKLKYKSNVNRKKYSTIGFRAATAVHCSHLAHKTAKVGPSHHHATATIQARRWSFRSYHSCGPDLTTLRGI